MLAIKRVKLGECPIFYNELFFNRPKWSMKILERMNNPSRDLYARVLDKVEEKIFVRSSPGMLMGMFNAASTTLGSISVGYRADKSIYDVTTLRLSDDSMSKIAVVDKNWLSWAVESHRRNQKHISINPSPGKTFAFTSANTPHGT